MGEYRVECAAAQMGFDLKVRGSHFRYLPSATIDLNPYSD